jgi:hypothetical protein
LTRKYGKPLQSHLASWYVARVGSRSERTAGFDGSKNGRQCRGTAARRHGRCDDFRNLILGMNLVDEALHLRAIERTRAKRREATANAKQRFVDVTNVG